MSVFTQLGGGATQLSGVYEVDNSLVFNDDDSPLVSRTFSTAPSDQKLTTISFWFKIGNITSGFRSLYRYNDGTNTGAVYLRNGNDLQFAWDVSSGSLDVRPDGVLRDPSAWYHCHIKVDTTQSTASNRVIIHINGVERTYSTATYPNQNATLEHLSNGETYYIGGDGQSSDKYFDGYIAEFNVIDGQAKEYTDFGEFNDNGVWIPKKYGGTYGNNGFYLEFQQTGTSQNSSGIGADTSGNDLHWAVTNLEATDVTKDTCTNNFATLNPLTARSYPVLRQGNLQQYDHSTGNSGCVASTIMPISGKWYCEMFLENPSPGDYPFFGITDTLNLNQQGDQGSKMAAGFEIDGATNNQSTTNLGTITNTNTGWPTFADNDIVMFALDCDNRKWWLGRNGTWINSGDPAAGTGQQLSWTNDTEVCSVMMGYSGGGGGGDGSIWNFSNPVAITISSGNADADGHGNFEYSVPSGYFALCSKNLAEYG